MMKVVKILKKFSHDPKETLKLLKDRSGYVWRSLALDKNTRKFIRHNNKIWRRCKNKIAESVILADLYAVNETNIARSYFLNILAMKSGAAIYSFSSPTAIPMRVLHKVYRSFNTAGHITTILNRDQKRRMKIISRQVIPCLKTKKDVYDINVLGIWIGVDVYESYLKDYNKPTVFMDDPALFKTVENGIGLVIFWQDYFSKNCVKAVVASHDCYLCFNVVCKVAYQLKVPVYFPNPIYATYADAPYQVHEYFGRYRQMFNRLPHEERQKAIALAKKQLSRRLNGEVGVDMPYATKSAFHPDHGNGRIIRESDKIKVLICTHCFYDNPHGYGGMLFLDFYEWLSYLGRISEKTNYDWYLKMHPDPLPGTLEIVQGILAQFPKIGLISHETSYHQLAKEGLDFVLTVYGSVGGECPLLGIQVINAGYNPRIAYDFNWHPKSLDEYEHYLLSLDKLHKDIKEEDVYEFYYMHHYYADDDDLVFKSYKQLLSDLTREERIGSMAYKYFLDQWSDVKHLEIINNMQRFIDSGKQHYLSHGPE